MWTDKGGKIMAAPFGLPVVGGSCGYVFGTVNNLLILPGGMANAAGIYFMIVAGWVAFSGTPPL